MRSHLHSTRRWAYATLVTALAAALLQSLSASAQDLKIGVSAPLSGPAAPIGDQMKTGVEAAIRRFNEGGGIGSRKLLAIFKDDQCNPAAGDRVVRELVDVEKADVLLGFPCSGVALSARNVAISADKLFITLATAGALTSEGKPNVIRPIGRDDALARTSVDILRKDYQGKKIGAVLSKNARGFATMFRSVASSRNVKFERLAEEADENVLSSNWTGVDVVFISPGLDSNVVRKFAAEAKTPVVIAKTVFEAQDEALLRSSTNVRLITNPAAGFFPGAVRRTGADGTATGYFAYGYAAVEIFAALAAQSKDMSGAALGKMAREKDIPTVLGSLKFAAGGDPAGWRFAVWSKTAAGSGAEAVDVCKRSDCKDFECPPDCPTK